MGCTFLNGLPICDPARENRAYVHTKFDHIFGFISNHSSLIKITVQRFIGNLMQLTDFSNLKQ